MITFTDNELELLSDIIYETIYYVGNCKDYNEKDPEYELVLRIRLKIDSERKERNKGYIPNEKPKKQSRFDGIVGE